MRDAVLVVCLMAMACFGARRADAACYGEFDRITEKMEQIRATAEAEVRTSPTRYANGQARFYEVSRDGAVVAWVLGTMHQDYPEFKFVDPPIAERFLKADALLMETSAAMTARAIADRGLVRRFASFNSTPIGEHVLVDLGRRHPDFIANLAILKRDADVLGRRSQSDIKELLSSVHCFKPESQVLRRGMSMDKLMEAWAIATGKPVIGMEDDPMIEVDWTAQRKALDTNIDLLPLAARRANFGADYFNFGTHFYFQGRVDLVVAAQRSFLATPEDRAVMDMDATTTVAARNLLYPPVIGSEIKAGRKPFVAVGAAHLIGDKGLIVALAGLGYSVTPVFLPPRWRD